MQKLKTTILFVAICLFATSCHDYLNDASGELALEKSRYGEGGGPSEEDDDSDRPDWAGGNTDANPHKKGNDNSGTKRGGDYGDLFKLLRDENGVPIMTPIDVEGDGVVDFYVVQPVDVDGIPLPLDAEGHLVNPELAIEVEFGRLNIVRSPTSVLDQALREALKVLDADGAVITLDFCGRLTSTYPVSGDMIVKTIDSPRENMAIYRTIMQDLTDDRLAFLGDLDPLTVAASCFAAGSDKTGTVDIDEVVYINGFMDCVGLNPILNANEDNKEYFNFSEPILGGAQFQYNRGVYADRYLKIITLNEDGTYSEVISSVLEAMEGRFTFQWGNGDLTQVDGFATAVDDAVQVLDFVHGDSNIEFLPDHDPNQDSTP